MPNAFLTSERLQTSAKPGQGLAGLSNKGQSAGRQPLAPLAPRQDTEGRMTMRGVMTASGMLAALLMVGAFFGWAAVETNGTQITQFPSWIMGATVAGFVLLGVTWVKPGLTKFIAPAYAIVEGLIVGAISHVYEVQFNGIVIQAVLATAGVFVGMLVVYSTGLIKVTDKFRKGVMAATMAIMAMYVVQLVSRLFGSSFEIPFLHDSGPIGILLSLGIIVIASFNYLLHFDFIERAVKAGAPRDSEWQAAFGLLVTTVWLYFEILRLLSKLRD